MAAGAATAGGPEAEAASLRGELCCVDTEPGLRPFTGHSSPGGKQARDGTGRVNATDLLPLNTTRLLTEDIYQKYCFITLAA